MEDLERITRKELIRRNKRLVVARSSIGNDRLHFLHQNQGKVLWHEAKHATILTMDVVESTDFTRAMHLGLGGGSKVRGRLQILHNELINPGLRYGSTIQLFVGDSQLHLLNTLFEHPNPELAAANIGYRFQNTMGMIKRGGKFELEARIAGHHGTVYLATLGNDKRSELVALGDSLKKAELFESVANAGKFVITPELYERLEYIEGTWVELKRKGKKARAFEVSHVPFLESQSNLTPTISEIVPVKEEGNYVWITQSDCSLDDIISRFIGQVKLPVLTRGQSENVIGSMLYVQLNEIPPLSPQVIDLLRHVHGQIIDAVYEKGGEVDKITAGSQVAYFGLYDDHGEHARRAVAVVQDVNKLARDIKKSTGIAIQMGVATGDVTLANLGNTKRSEVSSSGASIIDSHRIMSRHKVGIGLVSSTTQRYLLGKIEFGDLEEIKGKNENEKDIVAYQIRGDLQRRRNILFGSEHELTLYTAYTDAREGRANAIRLEGEYGLGKSATLDNFILNLEAKQKDDDSRIFNYDWSSVDKDATFKFVKQVIYDILELTDKASLHKRLQSFGINGETGQALAHLFDLNDDGYNNEEQAREAIIDAFYQVMIGYAISVDKPIVLTIDNSQYLDKPSHDALNYLCDNLEQKLMVVLSHRPCLDRKYSDKIETKMLQPLENSLIEKLIVDIMRDDFSKIHSSEVQKIKDIAKGNPVYAREVALTFKQYCEDNPDIEIISQKAAEEMIPLPDRVFDLSRHRIKNLGRQVYENLQVAAVASGPEDYFYLEDLSGTVEQELTKEQLEQLVELSIIERGLTSKTYKWVNTDVRDSLVSTIPSDPKYGGRLEELNEKFADNLQLRFKDREEDVVVKLAWHLANSTFIRRQNEAIPLLEIAARKAYNKFHAHEIAADLYAQAVEIFEGLLEVEGGRTDENIMKFAGLVENTVKYYLESDCFETCLHNLAKIDKVLDKNNNHYNYLKFMQGFRRGEASIIKISNLQGVTRPTNELNWIEDIHYQIRDIAQKISEGPDSSIGNLRRVTGFYLNEGELYRYRGEHTIARMNYDKVIDLCDSNIVKIRDDVSSEFLLHFQRYRAKAHSNKGLSFQQEAAANKNLHERLMERSFESYHISIDLARELGDKRLVSNFINGLAIAHQSAGNLTVALTMYEAAYMAALEGGKNRVIIRSAFNIGTQSVLKFFRDHGVTKPAEDIKDDSVEDLIAEVERARPFIEAQGKVRIGYLRKGLDVMQKEQGKALKYRANFFATYMERYSQAIKYILDNFVER